MTRKEVFDKVKRATVAIAIVHLQNSKHPFEIIGSGFCLDPTGIIVTCAHVLEAFMSKPIHHQILDIQKEPHNIGKEIKTDGPKSTIELLRCYCVFFDVHRAPSNLHAIPAIVDHAVAKTDKDIALLRVVKHKYYPTGYPFLEIEDYLQIHEGDEIAICGFPLGTLLQKELGTVTSSFTRGMVSSIIPCSGVDLKYLDGFLLDITATHGNSGGPVFSLKTGKVFGVLTRGVLDLGREIVPGIVKAEPIYPILETIPRLKVASFDNIAGTLPK